MVVLALAATKGGAGKSTVAISLGVAAAQAGLKVLILDSDPQKSVVQWKKRRRRDGGPIIHETALRAVPRHLAKARELGFDLVLIDFAAGDSVAFYDVFKRVDLVVVPSAPAVIEMQEAVPVFNAARAAQLDVTVALVRATRAQSGRTRFWIDKYGEKGAGRTSRVDRPGRLSRRLCDGGGDYRGRSWRQGCRGDRRPARLPAAASWREMSDDQ